MTSAITIDEVIERLEGIIDWARENESRSGYFPALYLKVTRQVREGIKTDFFDDGPRMERLDVLFANRYLNAFYAHRDRQPVTNSWQVALEAAENRRLMILQHLLLGMNAHINFDLGIAAAEVATGANITGIMADFNRINGILRDLIDGVQKQIDNLSPWMAALDWVGGRKDEQFADFSLSKARQDAWRFAKELAAADVEQRRYLIQLRDRIVAELARLVEGRRSIRPLIHLIRCRESRQVGRNIEVLLGTKAV